MNIIKTYESDDNTGSSDDEFDEQITLGKSSQFLSIKWKFPDTKKCPLNECDLSFSSRLFAIVHFRLSHAATAMLCTICNVPFSLACASNLETHYKNRHPNASLPKLKSSLEIEDRTDGKYFDDIDDYDDDVDDNEFGKGSDWIELSGFGKIHTRWKFPLYITRCPVLTCSLEFCTRSATIFHYKDKHASNAILCYLCDWPILDTDFSMHFRLIHPNEVIPFHFDTNASEPSPIEKSPPHMKKDAAAKTNDDQNFDDDLIELNGCQVQTFWRWPPKLSHCPNSKCKENRFADCETAKKHFIQNHAPYAIFCELCEKPIASPTLSNYKKHYSRLHPKEKIPIGLGEKSTTFDRKYCTRNTRNGKTVKKIEPAIALVPSPLAASECKSISKKPRPTKNNDAVDDLIVLRGSHQLNFWRFPQWMTRCPSKRCSLNFGTRSECVQHFRKQHASSYFLCQFCAKPIYAPKPCIMKAHFKNFHPLYRFENEPALDTNKGEQQTFEVPTKPSTNEEKFNQNLDQDEENEWITLKGCHIETKWRFPQTARCPSRLCLIQFLSRSDCYRHYQKVHAPGSILCPICDKPIKTDCAAGYLIHHRRLHGETKIPYDFVINRPTKTPDKVHYLEKLAFNGEDEQKKDLRAHKKNRTHQNAGSLIELNSCGIVSWFRYPNMKRCINVKCNMSFETRAEAIMHYKIAHSSAAIYCKLCQKPVHTKYPAYWKRHCERKHPQINLRTNAGSESIGTSSTVPKSPVTMSQPSMPKRSQQKHPLKSVAKMFCPLKECNYKTRRMRKLHGHWDKEHSDLRFPIAHEKQSDDAQAAPDSTKHGHNEIRSSENDVDDCLLIPLPDLPDLLSPVTSSDDEPFGQAEQSTSTTESLFDLDRYEMEVDLPEKEQQKVSQISMHSAFVLGEAHSLRPEEFDCQ